MTADTACSQCRRLNHFYNEAVLRYMLYNSRNLFDTKKTRDQEQILLNEMNKAKRAMFAHLDSKHDN